MRRSFPREMASLEAIVAFVREFIAREGLDERAAYEIDLVLEELFTNLVKYGRGARGDVEIWLERGAPGVTAELREFDADPFDPTLHEAVTTEPALSPEDDHTVAKVFQPGYRFNGQLLRPARVVVKQWNG